MMAAMPGMMMPGGFGYDMMGMSAMAGMAGMGTFGLFRLKNGMCKTLETAAGHGLMRSYEILSESN